MIATRVLIRLEQKKKKKKKKKIFFSFPRPIDAIYEIW